MCKRYRVFINAAEHAMKQNAQLRRESFFYEITNLLFVNVYVFVLLKIKI